MASYHDLHITTPQLPRTSIFNLPFGMSVTCTRTAGWELWSTGKLHAGEYDGKGGLRLDVDGHIIVDTLAKDSEPSITRQLLYTLKDLVAVVRGECPGLLDEDSGGDARLDAQIDQVIAQAEGRASS